MKAHEIQKLYRYNRWATDQIIDRAGKLTPEEFLQPDDTPFGSVRNQLVHILGAQQGWVRIWESNRTGFPHETEYLSDDDFPDMASIRALRDDVEARTDIFVRNLSDEELSETVVAEFFWGSLTAPLWEMMVQMVMHGVQHRSEVAMKLTNFGYSPGMLDLLYFQDQDSAVEEAGVSHVE